MWSPHAYAAGLGVVVEYRTQAEPGLWWPDTGRITLRRGMTAAHERSVLAHELGHEHYADPGSSSRTEARADRWAAQHLLTAEAVAECARAYPEHPDKWCRELQVTPHVLRVWMSNPSNYARAAALLRSAA